MSADYTPYLESARAAAGSQNHPTPALYMVATPVGNLADIGLRALHILQIADVVACEDTRHSGALLRQYGLQKELLALHQHNEYSASQTVLDKLGNGKRVVYISDAGTPGISDPGGVLCRVVREQGYPVIPIPGASSVSTLLSVAGCDTSAGYVFKGFLPSRGKARTTALQNMLAYDVPVVFFEAPHRIAQLAKNLEEHCGQALWSLLIGRELTKQFEQIACIPAHQMADWLAADSNHQRGEFAFVLYQTAASDAAKTPTEAITPAAESLLKDLLAHLPPRLASNITAKHTGANKKTLYERAVQIKNSI